MEAGIRVSPHWLTASLSLNPYGDPRRAVDQLLTKLDDPIMGERAAGRYNQPRYFVTVKGAKVYHGSEVAGQPWVLELDGTTCEGVDVEKCLEVFGDSIKRVTRFDLAADVEGPSLVARCLEDFKAGRYQGRIHPESWKWDEEGKAGSGRTCYIGSSSSPVQLCCYDRRGPTRFELRLRGNSRDPLADAVAKVYQRQGAAAAWASARSRFGRFTSAWWAPLEAGPVTDVRPEAWKPSTLQETIEAIRAQYGPVLFLLRDVGVDLDALTVEPKAGDWKMKQRRLLFEKEIGS